MATRPRPTTAATAKGDTHNVTSSAPFYVLKRSQSAGYYDWSQLLPNGDVPANPNHGAYIGYETETAALDAIKAHKAGSYVYDYLIVRALSVVAVRPVVETVVTEVKL